MSGATDSGGMGSGTEYDTIRGRDYPTIRQFTVFMENRVGQLLNIIRRFEGSGIKIVAININDATECCIVRFLLSDPERGREIFERAGLAMIESDLIGIQLPDTSQPLLSVCKALLQAEGQYYSGDSVDGASQRKKCRRTDGGRSRYGERYVDA